MILKYGSKGQDVQRLQNQLIEKGYNLIADGDFGHATETAVKDFQAKSNLVADGIVGNATLSALNGQSTSKLLKDSDIINGAKRLGVDEDCIRAFSEVESNGTGYLSNGKPKILFERHRFYAYLAKKHGTTYANNIASKYPNICNTATGGYQGGVLEWNRLALAQQIDEECALQSASWGRFQLMGENWKALKYASVQEFTNQHIESESLQFEAFLRFVEWKSGTVNGKKTTLKQALQNQDWHAVFTLYNGANYKKLGYDTKFLRVLNRLKH